jgi:hypothetical protein
MGSKNKMKYAMSMDPRVLQHDFVSTGLDDIPKIVSILKSISSPSMYDPQVSKMLHFLWFNISEGKGINLRDREKLLPIFKEYARIFKQGESHYTTAYRGVILPTVYDNLISKNKDNLDNLDSIPLVKKVLESLAYGLRSWSNNLDIARSWAGFGSYDSVVFIQRNPKIIFDCNSYFKFFQEDELYPPFDRGELVRYLKNPKVLSIKREKQDDPCEVILV